MPRVKGGPKTRKRRKKWLKQAKGYWGARSKLYKTARLAVMKSLVYAYRDRKRKKRDMRRLFIIRINAAARENGMSYSKFMNGLMKLNIGLNRKILAELAVENPVAFKSLVEKIKKEGG